MECFLRVFEGFVRRVVEFFWSFARVAYGRSLQAFWSVGCFVRFCLEVKGVGVFFRTVCCE